MTSIEPSAGDPPKRTRQVNEEAATRKAVRLALDDVLRSIGHMQQVAVLLETQVTRAPARHDCVSAIRSLEQSLLDVSERLEAVVTSLPERQRTHSRITDARRALDGVRLRIKLQG